MQPLSPLVLTSSLLFFLEEIRAFLGNKRVLDLSSLQVVLLLSKVSDNECRGCTELGQVFSSVFCGEERRGEENVDVDVDVDQKDGACPYRSCFLWQVSVK